MYSLFPLSGQDCRVYTADLYLTTPCAFPPACCSSIQMLTFFTTEVERLKKKECGGVTFVFLCKTCQEKHGRCTKRERIDTDTSRSLRKAQGQDTCLIWRGKRRDVLRWVSNCGSIHYMSVFLCLLSLYQVEEWLRTRVTLMGYFAWLDYSRTKRTAQIQ